MSKHNDELCNNCSRRKARKAKRKNRVRSKEDRAEQAQELWSLPMNYINNKDLKGNKELI